ncbi:MAG: 4Fe-4S dicluster domain-containing protein [Caldilineaceae bacterium]
MSTIHLIESTQDATVERHASCERCPLLSMNAKLSRRSLLKWTGVSATSLILATALASQVRASVDEPAMGNETQEEKAVGMLIDLTRCTGCQSCALACQVANDRPQTTTPPARLESDAYSFIDTRSSTAGDDSETIYVKRQCMHCLHPACVSACTVGALRKSETGPVVYDASKCIGCRYCQYACPFGVPTYDWENALGLIHKCQMCAARQQEGELPACIAACPNGALRFGKRHELLAQAHAQIASNPERYIDHVYGEFEAGGTSVLYLSAVPFATLGFPDLGNEPIPHYAEMVMERTPLVALGVATVATVLHRLTRPAAHTVEVTLDDSKEGEGGVE